MIKVVTLAAVAAFLAGPVLADGNDEGSYSESDVATWGSEAPDYSAVPGSDGYSTGEVGADGKPK